MKIITIKSQKEFDDLPTNFSEYTQIHIISSERVIVNVAWENSSVVARENSSVVARENSSVVAWGNSSVVAWENSSVVARENSSVVAWGNSSVVARENSSVVARENSSVVAWGNVGVHLFSDYATVILFMFSVCWQLAKGKIEKKSENATIITPKQLDFFENNGIEKKEKIILYKKVSKDFKTQENTSNETLWSVGSTIEHLSWNPEISECGEGKFHACSRPYFCDEFRSEKEDIYIAIEIELKDTYQWKNPEYPHKIAFRKGLVLYQCDKFGKKI